MDINTTKTEKAKLTFNSEAQSQLVVIKRYHNVNEIFNASEFMEDIFKKQQNIIFSGDGDSHQNEAAARTTKTVATMESTMLTHVDLICPEETLYADIWSMTTYYAVWIYNRIPGMQYGLSAIEIWSRLRFEPVSETLRNHHVLVCPTYVL